MRIAKMLLLCSVILPGTAYISYAPSITKPVKKAENTATMAAVKYLNAKEFMKLSAKEFSALTGKKMNVADRFLFI